jgi:ATP-dependent Clp protease ATP-binding subunit ClpA
MFERYTERARRVIFFGRYETSRFGGKTIGPEHLLLGLLREDSSLLQSLLQRPDAYAHLQAKIEARATARESVSTSIDLPLSEECRRILGYVQEEADNLGHSLIGCEHLLLGILREKGCLAAELLAEAGLTLDAAREVIAKSARVVAVRTDHSSIHGLVDKLSPDRLDLLKVVIEKLLSDKSYQEAGIIDHVRGRMSSAYDPGDGSIVVDTRQSFLAHQISIKEQFKWQPDSKTLRYTHEVAGPILGQRHTHSFEFDVPGSEL